MRGHQFLFGVVVVASWETGMTLDVEVLSKHCHACSRKGYLDPTSPEFLDWWEGHQAVCCINYTGSSNAMEKDGAVRIWERSVEKYKLRYTSMISDADTSMISDADSSTYPNLRDAAPYGNDHLISKHECIGHVQKRMFKYLETMKKKVHLDAEGKRVRIGGASASEVLWQGHPLQCGGSGMKRAVMASFYRSMSTDDNPLHKMCPSGVTSWCRHKLAEAKNEPSPSHHPITHPDIALFVSQFTWNCQRTP